MMGARMNLAHKSSLVTWVLIVGLCIVSFQSEAHYLEVSSRWLVKESDGERIKLACVNWASHLETMVPEGLNRQPSYRLGLAVKRMGFNCVRLTFATYMFTDPKLSNLTVIDSFKRMNLQTSLRGIAIHNPDLLDLTVQEALAHVVARLTRAGLLIILDNHVSKPQWCCKDKDGNGFWGDTFFDENSWLQGLSLVASLFNNNTEVVGISLRNELRGPKQNTQDWYKYMSLGAKTVHDANPNLLIILSGLRYETDLRFLAKRHISSLPFQNKLVYEMHWYTSSYGSNFAMGNLNKACAIATSSIMKCGAFMTSPSLMGGNFTAPLFISEFGIDQRGCNKGNNRFINCFFAFMASMDLDWAYWPLQGNYYLRNGREGDEEFYGLLNSQWNAPRNISLLARLKAIQEPWQSGDDKNSSRREYQVLFHPATGLCLQKGSGNTLVLGPCMESTTHWSYTPQGRLEIQNSYLCVASDGEGQFAKLVPVGTEKNGPWSLASVAKLQFATTITHSHALEGLSISPVPRGAKEGGQPRSRGVTNFHNQAITYHEPTFDQHDNSDDLAQDFNQANTYHYSTFDLYDNLNDLSKDLDQANTYYDPAINTKYDNLNDIAKHLDQHIHIDDNVHGYYDNNVDHNYDDNTINHHPHIDDHGNGCHEKNNDCNDDDNTHVHEDAINDSDYEDVGNDHIEYPQDNTEHMTKTSLVSKPQAIHHNPILCLDGSTPPSVTTKRCVCVQEDDMDCGKDDDPSSQWFVLITKSTGPSVLEYDDSSKT